MRAGEAALPPVGGDDLELAGKRGPRLLLLLQLLQCLLLLLLLQLLLPSP